MSEILLQSTVNNKYILPHMAYNPRDLIDFANCNIVGPTSGVAGRYTMSEYWDNFDANVQDLAYPLGSIIFIDPTIFSGTPLYGTWVPLTEFLDTERYLMLSSPNKIKYMIGEFETAYSFPNIMPPNRNIFSPYVFSYSNTTAAYAVPTITLADGSKFVLIHFRKGTISADQAAALQTGTHLDLDTINTCYTQIASWEQFSLADGTLEFLVMVYNNDPGMNPLQMADYNSWNQYTHTAARWRQQAGLTGTQFGTGQNVAYPTEYMGFGYEDQKGKQTDFHSATNTRTTNTGITDVSRGLYVPWSDVVVSNSTAFSVLSGLGEDNTGNFYNWWRNNAANLGNRYFAYSDIDVSSWATPFRTFGITDVTPGTIALFVRYDNTPFYNAAKNVGQFHGSSTVEVNLPQLASHLHLAAASGKDRREGDGAATWGPGTNVANWCGWNCGPANGTTFGGNTYHGVNGAAHNNIQPTTRGVAFIRVA